MTADELERLKQAQRQALKGGNLAELNRINKILFDERENANGSEPKQKSRNTKKCFLPKLTLSAKNCFLRKMGESCRNGFLRLSVINEILGK